MLITRINAQDLAFVVHVGDIGTSGRNQGCSDAWIAARKRQFEALRHPFVLLPGDNEWTDCHVTGFDPPKRMTYRLVAGAPIRDHSGEVRFDREGAGTRVTWKVDFRPLVPGTGGLIRRVLERGLRDTLARLARTF